jgi:hypothetical protein
VNTPSILLTIQGGKIVGATANGKVNLFIEQADTLNGIEQIHVNEIPCSEFQSFLDGRIPEKDLLK